MKSSHIVSVMIGIVMIGAGAVFIEKRLGSMGSIPSITELTTTQSVTSDTELPKLGTMPELTGIKGWINSPPRATTELKGKVVLVDFWTYSCINCIRTFPYLKDWWSKYKDEGLVILGVHTPEFAFEKEFANVERAAKDYGLAYPIALDNDYSVWNAFSNHYWPAHYLFDREGTLRHYHFGEGNYDETELAIQQLLGVHEDLSTEEPAPAYRDIHTPETYFGWGRSERFASPETVLRDQQRIYAFPQTLVENAWALEGNWVVTKESVELKSDEGAFRFHYNAGAVHLVMDTVDQTRVTAQVFIDGQPIQEAILGEDVTRQNDGTTTVDIEFPKAHTLVDGPSGSHIVEVRFAKPGAKIYAITFGANN